MSNAQDTAPPPGVNMPDHLGLRYLPDPVMSNFDHVINAGVGAELERGGCYAQYAGWNFCGYVWWEAAAKTFNCEVWVYGSPREIISGSLSEIMGQVCEKYGDD